MKFVGAGNDGKEGNKEAKIAMPGYNFFERGFYLVIHVGLLWHIIGV